MYLRKAKTSAIEEPVSPEEQKLRISEVRGLLGPLVDRVPKFCSDDSISRFLRARSWNAEKASKMLKESLKWRLEYKPETIRWEDVSHEAETGKIYRANYLDKFGRPVLVMRPGFQNTKSTKGQIRYLVYCMENAILNLPKDQEQMVWLIDFQGWTMGSVSMRSTRETAHILQDYYPERLALGILYNPPKIFESFWKVVKPFLDQKTYKKVRFVYSDNAESQKVMTNLFDMDKLESAFGGQNQVSFDFNRFAEQMKEEDKKMVDFLKSGASFLSEEQPLESMLQQPESTQEHHSDDSLDSSSSSDTEATSKTATKILPETEIKEASNCKNTAVVESEILVEMIPESA